LVPGVFLPNQRWEYCLLRFLEPSRAGIIDDGVDEEKRRPDGWVAREAEERVVEDL
jgi:hypothetical protein